MSERDSKGESDTRVKETIDNSETARCDLERVGEIKGGDG
jgi:hypothetical protein